MHGGLTQHATAAQFPGALAPLFAPKRFKVLYGGRGAGRSWGIARALLILNLQSPERTLCAREFQNSIRESVHRLLSDQIDKLGMNYLYEIQQAVIRGRADGQCKGAEFTFEGLRANADKIKSYEGVKRCWVEEADKTSDQSWKDLIPTIRRDDSEIWMSLNPQLATDATAERFIEHPPGDFIRKTMLLDPQGRETGGTCTETTRAFVIWHSYRDNMWFPQVLRLEMEELKARNFDEYMHVWEGHYKQSLEGAVYAEELRDATVQGRIRDVPYDRTLGVNCYFDLGRSNFTAIWFEQRSVWEHRFIDFYKAQFKDIDHYMQVLQGRGYTYDTIWLPHDAFAKRLGHSADIATQMRAKGFFVREVPRMTITNGIDAARGIFANSYFDKAKCADGLTDLRHYRYKIDPQTKQFSQEPMHDEYSDGADAFRYAGIGSKLKRRGRAGRIVEEVSRRLLPGGGEFDHGLGAGGGTGWLGR